MSEMSHLHLQRSSCIWLPTDWNLLSAKYDTADWPHDLRERWAGWRMLAWLPVHCNVVSENSCISEHSHTRATSQYAVVYD